MPWVINSYVKRFAGRKRFKVSLFPRHGPYAINRGMNSFSRYHLSTSTMSLASTGEARLIGSAIISTLIVAVSTAWPYGHTYWARYF
jgi:hypothetical protein